MDSKGKQAAGKEPYRKRTRGNDSERADRGLKRRNRQVLQFFEDTAAVTSDDDSSDYFDSDMEEEFDPELKIKSEPGKASNFPLFPKEEEQDEEEFDRMMEERYKKGSGFVKYAEDDYESKKSIERKSFISDAKDPVIWKVKCMVGRERYSAFCLMQKFVDLQSLGTKLQIISAFAVEHVKGFVYIEADKQCDVMEACKGLCTIYSTRMIVLPRNEVYHLLSFQSKPKEVSEGMWARVKNGKYKGDLSQVVFMNDTRKKATIKLIPRIDLQAMAQKFGGGVPAKRGAVPAPRLISPNELEEFRPLIQHRRDRDTGQMFEVFDGLMLKDGYLYKKVSVDSLNCLGVTPSEEELIKFRPTENNESEDVEWLSQIYGERKKKKTVKIDKAGEKGAGEKGAGEKGAGEKGAGEKGEGSSGSSVENNFDTYDLVCFGRKDFGLILGKEKDDCFKILKEGLEGPVVVSVETKELKSGPLDTKFTALDQHMKTISVNDVVKVSEGPLKGRQGSVKQVYRGTLFLYDENETENGGYFCCKSQMCEKIKLSIDAGYGKDGEPSGSCLGDFSSSPKSPLSPKKPWEARESNNKFNRGDKDGMSSVGQIMRIRVGPLKGYLCRVLAIRYSDVTVKLDSKHKVLTVKSEHLAEVRGKCSTMSMNDTGPSSFKPFDLAGTEGSSGGWMDTAGTSAEGDPWNAAKPTSESGAWPSFPAAGISTQPASSLFGSEDKDSKDSNGSTWERKVTPNPGSSWGTSEANKKPSDESNQGGSWSKATGASGSGTAATDGWGKATVAKAHPDPNHANLFGSNDNDPKDSNSTAWEQKLTSNQSSWGTAADSGGVATDSWGKATIAKDHTSLNPGNLFASKGDDLKGGTAWDNKVTPNVNSSWGTSAANEKSADGSGQAGGWNNWGKAPVATGDAEGKDPADSSKDAVWGKKDGGSSWSKQEGGSSWSKQDGGSSWSKPDGGSSWSKPDGGSSWSKQADQNVENGSNEGKNQDGGWGSTKSFGEDSGFRGRGRGSGGRRGGYRGGREQFGRGRSSGRGQSSGGQGDGGSSWGNKQDGGSSWGNKQDGGSSWGNKQQDGGSSWGNKQQDGGSSWGNKQQDGGSSWGNKQQDGGSSWGNKQQDVGSSWGNKQQDGGSSWGKKQEDGGSSWGNKPQDGGSTLGNKQQDGGSSWGNKQQDGGSSWGNKQQDGGSSWGNKQQDGGSSWGNKQQDGGSSWGNKQQDGGSSLGNKQQDGGSSWGNKQQEGGSSWGNKPQSDGGASWGTKQKDEGKQDGGTSWDKKQQDGGSSWGNKQQGGGSSWGNKQQEGGSSWGNKPQEGGSSWGNKPQDGGSGGGNKPQAGGSGWGNKQQDGGSSWGNKQQDGGSGWANKPQDGGSSWSNKQNDGGSNWGNKQQDGGSSWGSKQDGSNEPRSFNRGGRGSGGRTGGFRGGRNQYGGGRTSDSGGGSWKSTNAEGDDSGSTWKQGWGADNNKKSSETSGGGGGDWASWGQATTNKEVKAATVGGSAGGWDNTPKNEVNSTSKPGGWDNTPKNEVNSTSKPGGWDNTPKNEVNSTSKPGGWDKQGGNDSGNWGSSGDQAKSSNAAEGSSEGGGGQTDSWGKAAGSSWGNTKNGSDKGGW